VSTDIAQRPFLTRAEVAELLRVTTRTVDRHSEHGLLHPVRLVHGGRVLFDSDEVDRVLAEKKRR
jgi:excisionase family DNA binding protein